MRLDQLNEKLPGLLLEVFERVSATPLENAAQLIKPIDEAQPGCIIFNGGGGMMALVPNDAADEFVEAIESSYPQATGMATITAVSQPITPDDVRGIPHKIEAAKLRQQIKQLPPEAQTRIQHSYDKKAAEALDDETVAKVQGIPRLMRQQQMLLRQKKQAKQIAPLMEAGPFARRCQSCGKRPSIGVIEPTAAGEQAEFFCQVCHDNHEAGKDGRSHWQREFVEWFNDEHPSDTPVEAVHNKDLSDIGADSEKARYVGYIYTDGNNIGQLLEKSGSLREYAGLSKALTKAMVEAVFQALAAFIVKDGRLLHFEIITIGGDDAILIVPAHVAIPVAREICRLFGEKLHGLNPDEPPGMSAGVVIAQEKNPIYFLNDLAKQLLKNAKKGSRKQGQVTPCIDFMVLKSQSTVASNLGDLRQSEIFRVETQTPDERCSLTARPYTLTEIERLWQDAGQLNKVSFSAGQLHQMRRAFQKGRFPGIFHYLYQTARFSEQHRDMFHDIEAAWELAENNESGAPPWRVLPPTKDDYQAFDTPFLDMLELREFIPKQKEVHDARSD
jgi:CRISPR-associated protein Cmr2